MAAIAAPSGADPLATVPTLVELIDVWVEQLHGQIDTQRDLMLQLACASCGDFGIRPLCPLADCPHLATLRRAIRKTVIVLEATR